MVEEEVVVVEEEERDDATGDVSGGVMSMRLDNKCSSMERCRLESWWVLSVFLRPLVLSLFVWPCSSLARFKAANSVNGPGASSFALQFPSLFLLPCCSPVAKLSPRFLSKYVLPMVWFKRL